MNIKETINSASFFGFSVAFLFSIGGLFYYLYFLKKENYYYLDNPTKNEIEVSVDNKKYLIKPETFEKIELKKGKHAIKIQHSTFSLDTFLFVNDVNGVINPSLSDYYIYKKYYGYRKNKDSIIDALSKVKIDETYYRGAIVHCHDLTIEGFDYGLDESFPKIIQKDTLNDRKKIYRKKDFVALYPNLE